MKIYQTGGSVRDKILGVPPRDRDFLVTDTTEAELVRRGLVKVGETFPIFLDRETGDEYTLATNLAGDLARRDLTINAMAIDENGTFIDPFGGEEDLRRKVLRAVARENFFTDPLRVYRTARFVSQLPGFTIDPGTTDLMREVTQTEGFSRILSERIVKELRSVLQTSVPSRFFEVITELHAMDPWFSELKGKWSASVDRKTGERERFTLLCEHLTVSELESLSSRLRLQNDWKEFARAWILRPEKTDPENLIGYFYSIDGFRNPALVNDVAALCDNDALLSAFQLIKDTGMKDLSGNPQGKEIGEAIRAKRLEILRARS